MKKVSRVFVLGLCVGVAFCMFSTVYAQEAAKDKVKVTGAEYLKRGAEGAVIAGYNTQNGCAWMNVFLPDGKSIKQYYHCPAYGGFGAGVGTFQVVEDKICTKWDDGREFCSETYRIGEDKYESWVEKSDGTRYPIGTYYRLK